MRRMDKEITDQAEIGQILSSGFLCRVAFSQNNIPHIVPMNYGYDEGRLYFHSACTGKKIELIRDNPRVSFEVSDSIEVLPGEKACGFTTRYRSVIGSGIMRIIDDPEMKRRGLGVIMKQHTGDNSWEFDESELARLCVLELHIESVSGKKSHI
jgi:nitroimidazol reductase NimA-like FMN-containing flavoprotein (pyridoxamine 5'-phosphate oxidase superfamily)